MVNAGRRSKDALHGDGAGACRGGNAQLTRCFSISCGHGPSCCLPSLPLPEPFLSRGSFSRDINDRGSLRQLTSVFVCNYLPSLCLTVRSSS